MCSSGVVRPIISAFRADDKDSNSFWSVAVQSHRVAANPVGLWNLRQRFESAWDYSYYNFKS